MRFTKADLRASLLHDLSTAVPQAPEPEIEAAASSAVAHLDSGASLSLREVEHIVAKAVRELRAAPITFGAKPNIIAVETTKATDGDRRRSYRITRS
jgi:hypothetical protein